MNVNKKLLFLAFFSLSTAIIAFIFIKTSIVENIKNISDISSITQLINKKDQPTVKINDIEIAVDIVKTPEEKTKGLSGRKKLGEGEGMLFVFENKSYPSFWMKDMNFAIDIIWIADNKIVGIDGNVPYPQPATPNTQLPLYKPSAAIDYVLEVNGEFCKKNSINIDDTVNLSNINSYN